MKGSLKLLVLHLLSTEDSNGYNLIKSVSKHFGKKPSTGTIYPLLNRLMEEGYVEKTKEGRSSKYNITQKGLELYHQLIRQNKDKIKKSIDIQKMVLASSKESYKSQLMLLSQKNMNLVLEILDLSNLENQKDNFEKLLEKQENELEAFKNNL